MNHFKAAFSFLLLYFLIVLFSNQCALAGLIPQIGSKEDRKEYAQKMINSLRKIDESVPTLSPSQKAWLDNEAVEYKKTNNARRYIEVMESKEYKMRLVKDHTIYMIEQLKSIIQTNDANIEMFYWSSIATDLLDSGYWSGIVALGEFGLLDKKIFMDSVLLNFSDEMIYLNNGAFVSQQILRHIIKPFFLNNFKRKQN